VEGEVAWLEEGEVVGLAEGEVGGLASRRKIGQLAG